jgi:hypothetical protein
MKPIYRFLIVCITLLSCAKLFAQPAKNIVKQTQVVNGILKATANANSNARIHANSNSVFGTANNHPSESNKDQPKKNEIKVDKETQKNNKEKRQKN